MDWGGDYCTRGEVQVVDEEELLWIEEVDFLVRWWREGVWLVEYE
jgi:hypothetical protein